MIFSNRRPFQTHISIGPFTRSKFVIKNNCNDSFVLRVFFFLSVSEVVFCFVLCVFKAFSYSLILFRVKVRFRVRVRLRLRIMIRVRVRFRVRVKVRVRFRVRVRVKLRLRFMVRVRFD